MRSHCAIGLGAVLAASAAGGCDRAPPRPEEIPETTVSAAADVPAPARAEALPAPVAEHQQDTVRAQWSVSPSPVLVVGRGDGPGQDLLGVIGAVRLGDGTLVVADNGSRELRFFDGAGRLRSRSGGEGSGPGEFRTLQALIRLPGDSLAAYDMGLRRLSIFAPDGRFIRSAPVQGDAGAPLPVAGFGDGTLLVRESGTYSPGSTTAGLRRDSIGFARYDTRGNRLAALGRFPGSEIYVDARDGRFSVTVVPFARATVATAGGEQFFVATNERREVRGFTAAGGRAVVAREAEPLLRVTEQDLAAAVQRLAGNGGAGQRTVEQRLANVPRSRTHPAYRRLNLDPLGYLWATLAQRPGARNGRWSVFDAAGTRVQQITGPAITPLEVGRDYVVGLQTTDDGVEEVVVHSITRPDPR
ncbi:MAG: hypothetical protein KY467_07490 [Gemmatimonadetes bacterium]|nr:hypothetical protein [Gemmatimonadota bacterium]